MKSARLGSWSQLGWGRGINLFVEHHLTKILGISDGIFSPLSDSDPSRGPVQKSTAEALYSPAASYSRPGVGVCSNIKQTHAEVPFQVDFLSFQLFV